jgi:hypothetical protein
MGQLWGVLDRLDDGSETKSQKLWAKVNFPCFQSELCDDGMLTHLSSGRMHGAFPNRSISLGGKRMLVSLWWTQGYMSRRTETWKIIEGTTSAKEVVINKCLGQRLAVSAAEKGCFDCGIQSPSPQLCRKSTVIDFFGYHQCWGGLSGDSADHFELSLVLVSDPWPVLLLEMPIRSNWFIILNISVVIIWVFSCIPFHEWINMCCASPQKVCHTILGT